MQSSGRAGIIAGFESRLIAEVQEGQSMNEPTGHRPRRQWQDILFEVIFEADTPAGKWFDIVLIALICLSVATVMLDSVESIHTQYGRWLYGIEWFFTTLFTVEYVLRLLCVGRPMRYAISFFGISPCPRVRP